MKQQENKQAIRKETRTKPKIGKQYETRKQDNKKENNKTRGLPEKPRKIKN